MSKERFQNRFFDVFIPKYWSLRTLFAQEMFVEHSHNWRECFFLQEHHLRRAQKPLSFVGNVSPNLEDSHTLNSNGTDDILTVL